MLSKFQQEMQKRLSQEKQLREEKAALQFEEVERKMRLEEERLHLEEQEKQKQLDIKEEQERV